MAAGWGVSRWSWVCVVAAGCVVVGSFLPWETASLPHGAITYRGIDGGGDGYIAAGAALLAAAVVLAGARLPSDGHSYAWIAVVAGAVATYTAVIDLYNGATAGEVRSPEGVLRFSVRYGVVVAAAGATVLLIGAIVLVLHRRRPSEDRAAEPQPSPHRTPGESLDA